MASFKRRRIDDSLLIQGIASSNAVVGQERRLGSGTVSHVGRQQRTGVELDVQAATLPIDKRSSSVGQRSRPMELSGDSPLPSTLPLAEILRLGQNPGKGARQLSQTSLPSPAPSDENFTNSPLNNTRAVSRPSANRVEITPTHDAAHARLSIGSGSRPLANTAATTPTIGVASFRHSIGSGSLGIQATHPRPRLSITRVSPDDAAVPPAHITSQSQPGPAPRQPGPMQHFNAVDFLLNRLSSMEQTLRSQNELNMMESGRLNLLRDAVQTQDHFYQILHQLFCVRWLDPHSLPESMKMLDNAPYQYLERLLCANCDVSPLLVRLSAQFPGALMEVYSSPDPLVRQIFERYVGAVKDFLTRLPQGWDYLIQTCKQRQSPPLVQELVQTLHLGSRVLQDTAFRAISRLLRQSQAGDVASALEEAHQIDSETYHTQGFRRNQMEMEAMHATFARIVTESQKHASRNQAHSNAPDPLYLPEMVRKQLRALPPSMQMASSPSMSIAAQRRAQYAALVQQQQQQQQQPRAPTQQQPLLTPQSASAAQYQSRVTASSVPSNVTHAPLVLPQQTHAATRTMQIPLETVLQFPRRDAQQQRRVFPQPHELPRAQPTHPDPTRSALHQAHLRSPVLTPKIPANTKLYRHVIGYGLPPTRAKNSLRMQMVKFTVTQEAYDRLPQLCVPHPLGEPPRYVIDQSTHTYRLRCSAVPPQGLVSEGSWMVAENIWPDDFELELNGTTLEKRRKLHHGRYLPIDLTGLIQVGENTLRICRNRLPNDERKAEFAFAVEIVGVRSHESIHTELKRLSADTSLESIKKSLSQDGDMDDEVAVTSSSLTIKLFDPISAMSICQIPVRGAACLHRDCFDLDTFLGQCKRENPDLPTVVDCWRCPLCRGDVRPQTLVVDGFLDEVRKKLVEQDLTHTRTIVVESDGSWKPKEEERTGVRSVSLEPEETRGAKKPSIEIIELD